MSFINSMLDCKSIDTVIATAALQEILKHLWYLEETAVYALFSDNLDEEHKNSCQKNSFRAPLETLFFVDLLT